MTTNMNLLCVLTHPAYKPGDSAPLGYLAWHDWAEVQHRAGLRQVRCGHCLKHWFPQEVSGHHCVTP